MTPYSAGDLDRRITIQQRSVSKDSGGRDVVTWPARATVWAAKRDVSGREQMQAGQVTAEQITRFIVRWRADVADTDRILFGSTVYAVQHQAEVGRREFLQITAKRVVQP